MSRQRLGIEASMQRLQQQREEPAGSRADQHSAAPAQRLGQGWAKPAAEQDARRDRCLRDRECEWRVSSDRPPAEQLGTGGSGDGGDAVADQRRQHEARRTSDDRDGHAAAGREQCDLAHANRAVADDEPARSELTDQRGYGCQTEIDPNPRRVSVQFENDQRSEHRRQHSANRAAGLLQKHRHDGDQHLGQMARFLWVNPFQPKGLTASTAAAVVVRSPETPWPHRAMLTWPRLARPTERSSDTGLP